MSKPVNNPVLTPDQASAFKPVDELIDAKSNKRSNGKFADIAADLKQYVDATAAQSSSALATADNASKKAKKAHTRLDAMEEALGAVAEVTKQNAASVVDSASTDLVSMAAEFEALRVANPAAHRQQTKAVRKSLNGHPIVARQCADINHSAPGEILVTATVLGAVGVAAWKAYEWFTDIT